MKNLKFLMFRRNHSTKIEVPDSLPELGPWTTIFSSRVYAAFNPDLRASEANYAHFCKTGWKQIRRIHPEKEFDPTFYQSFYRDLHGTGAIQAYKHWLIFGIKEGRIATAREYLKQIGYTSETIPAYFYDSKIQGAQTKENIERFVAFYSLDLSEFAEFISGKNVETLDLVNLANFLIARNEFKKAQVALHFHLSKFPTEAIASHMLADLYDREGSVHLALNYYRLANKASSKSFWALLGEARSLAALRQFDEATEVIGTACRAFPESEIPRRLSSDYTKAKFDKGYHELLSELDDKNLSASQATVSAICEDMYRSLNSLIRGEVAQGVSGRVGKVGLVSFITPRQCFKYRVEQKISQLAANDISCEWVDALDLKSLYKVYLSCDVVVFHRLPAWPSIVEAILLCRQAGIPTFYDIDDLIIDPENYPPKFETMRGLVKEEDYNRLAIDSVLHLECAKLCDFGIGSTQAITEVLGQLVRTGRAFTHPNGYDAADYENISAPASAQNSDEIKIVYGSGSKSHSGYFHDNAASAILELMDQDSRVVLEVIGDLAIGKQFGRHSLRVRQSPRVGDFRSYLERLAGASINIAPLDNSIFAAAKSEIKWLEASLLGVPTIADATPVYASVIENGSTGFVCESSADWFEALRLLTDSPQLRADVGKKAKAVAKERYSSHVLGNRLVEALNSCCATSVSDNQAVKVAQVNVFFAPFTYGGATRVVEDLAFGISRDERFATEVFTTIPDGAVEGYSERFVVNNVPVTGVVPSGRNGMDVPENDTVTAQVFDAFLEKFKPDVIHFHCMQKLTVSLVDVALAKGIPYVVTVHDGWWVSDNFFLVESDGKLVTETGNWGNPRRLFRLRELLNRARKRITVSRTFERLYIRRGVKIDCVIKNPVTLIRQQLMSSGERLVIGFFGGLGLAKGGDLLMATLRQSVFNQLDFLVIDHTKPQSYSSSKCINGNRVSFIGRVPQNEMEGIYGRVNVVCVPSICIESFGLVAREAIAMGRWVIVSDRGGLKEGVTEGENGFVIDVCDIADLNRTLVAIDSEPDKYRSHSSFGSDASSEFDFVEEHKKLYLDIAGEARATSIPTRASAA